MRLGLPLVILCCFALSNCPAQGIPQSPKDGEKPPKKIRALIIDGQNNHDFLATTKSLKATLEATGRFKVVISRTPERKADPSAWKQWKPSFEPGMVVVCNYNGDAWPKRVRKELLTWLNQGGGLVNVHAANNAFPQWKEWNRIIGLGWRNSAFGRRLRIDHSTGKTRFIPASEKGQGAGHGRQHPFAVTVRAKSHPIMRGLPERWMHAKDELYHGQRGPGEDLNLLSSAFSSKESGGTGAHEPISWWIPVGKGRAVTTVLGHHWLGQKDFRALHCVGFQTVFARSAEWAATQKVTIPQPQGFPSPVRASVIPPQSVNWK